MPYDFFKNARTSGGSVGNLPFPKIPITASDKYEEWVSGSSRMDALAHKYYGDATLFPLIQFANPEIIDIFSIPDGYIIRIPFPKDRALAEYDSSTKTL